MGNSSSKYFTIYALTSSLVLGAIFIYLFLWKSIGISHFLFYLLVSTNVFIPAIIWEPQKLLKSRLVSYIALIAVTLMSTVFVFRMQEAPLVWAFLTLPVLYSIVYATIYNPNVVKRIGLGSYFMLPAILFVTWFGDLFHFLKGFRFGIIRSERARSVIWRVFVGTLIASPFLFIFLILMLSADVAFANLVEDVLRKVFIDWISLKNVVKGVIGALVALYLMVFNFSIWSSNSFLSQQLAQYAESKVVTIKQSWEPLIFSVVLALINFLFLTFIIVQFVYLFGGEENIIKGGYTYAEYARQGFKELVIITFIAYLIVYTLNLKVLAQSASQKLLFKSNIIFLVLMILIINISAHTRLAITEENYGYTGVRIVGHYLMAVMGVMIVVLGTFSLKKELFIYVNKINAGILLLAFMAYMAFPGDFLVARLNTERYLRTGNIDLPYMLSMSDEVIPSLIKLADNDKAPETMSLIINAELWNRHQEYKESDKNWQSFNFVNYSNQSKLEKRFDGKSNQVDEATETLGDFVDEYTELIEDGEFKRAHRDYWTSGSTFVGDEEQLSGVRVTKYNKEVVPAFESWSIFDIGPVDLSGNRYGDSSYSGRSYFNGMSVPVEMEYTSEDKFGKQCRTDYLYVILENGEWKITDADRLDLSTGLNNYSYSYGNDGDCF